MTIFGEEHFLDDKMCAIAHEIDNEVLDNIHKSSLEIGVRVDKNKLKHWLNLCGQLENIDRTALIDFAVQRKFNDKDRKIANLQEQNKKLKRALKLACKHINAWQLNHEPTTEYFIDQAEKEEK